jgi:hypothetical protein
LSDAQVPPELHSPLVSPTAPLPASALSTAKTLDLALKTKYIHLYAYRSASTPCPGPPGLGPHPSPTRPHGRRPARYDDLGLGARGKPPAGGLPDLDGSGARCFARLAMWAEGARRSDRAQPGKAGRGQVMSIGHQYFGPEKPRKPLGDSRVWVWVNSLQDKGFRLGYNDLADPGIFRMGFRGSRVQIPPSR